MNVLVFGGTRGVGQNVVEQALQAGHTVTVFARTPDSVTLQDPRLTVLRGDVMVAAQVDAAMPGMDAVVVALGAPALSKTKVRSDGTANVIAAMKGHGVKRLIAVSLLGLGSSRGNLTAALKYLIFPTYLRRPLKDHAVQERLIANSGLDWTVVRPPHLNDGPRTGDYRHGFGGDAKGLTLHVSRADVADLMLAELAAPKYMKQAAGISY